MDFTAFSHGQIQSKIWLCENLEKHIHQKSNVAILGCWYNVLGFLLLSRNQNLYSSIVGYDIDPYALEIANKINDGFIIETNIVKHICRSVSDIDFYNVDIIINTSVEDIGIDWYHNIPNGKLVCLQTLNLKQNDVANYSDWNIKNETENLDEFLKKYPMNKIHFQDTKKFNYGDLKYNRYMIIGKK